jgi:hypothetical protein
MDENSFHNKSFASVDEMMEDMKIQLQQNSLQKIIWIFG